MRTRVSVTLALLGSSVLLVTAVPAQQHQAGGTPQHGQQPRAPGLLVESTAFPDGGIVPLKYSIRGDNVQPDFRISNAPADTQSFAIIMHDVDAAPGGHFGDVLHWVAFNIPGTTKQIAEGKLPEGSMNGKNFRNNNAYTGPGAPPGPDHHYLFEFYALNIRVNLTGTASRPELLEAMNGHIVGKTTYVGRFHGTAPAAGPR
jgi:Raf kinase inhibitor-like YbhB/YbcL family protein